jgi:hypothetical protein
VDDKRRGSFDFDDRGNERSRAFADVKEEL